MTLKESLDTKRGVDIARAVGVTPVTVCAWKRGAALPPGPRIPSLALVLDMTEADLRALVAREREARDRKAKRAGKVMGRRGHGSGSCRKSATKPARNPGRSPQPVTGAKGGAK